MKLNRKYLSIGFYILAVIALTALSVFLFLNLSIINIFFKKIFKICAPLVYGACIAYALNPLMTWFEEKIFTPKRKKPFKRTNRRLLSVFTSICIVAIFLILFLAIIVPQLRISIQDIIEKLPEYIASFETLLEELNQSDSFIAGIANSVTNYIENLIGNPDELMQEYLPKLKDILRSVASVLLDIVLGVIFAGTFLYSKEYIIAHIQKISKSLFSEKNYNKIADFCNLVDETFGKYFVAAILDSILVGLICALLVKIAGMPYAPLIGVVIAVTNIIPIFGPFIGAIPCALILFVCDPSYAIIFGIMILVVQQIDGNIIVPRIHGTSTGLPPVWIITSVTIMSGLFGFVGMFIGVPCFSIIYMLTKQYIENRLANQSLATNTIDYMNADEKIRFISKNTDKKPVKEKSPKLFKFLKRKESFSQTRPNRLLQQLFSKISNCFSKISDYFKKNKK